MIKSGKILNFPVKARRILEIESGFVQRLGCRSNHKVINHFSFFNEFLGIGPRIEDSESS